MSSRTSRHSAGFVTTVNQHLEPVGIQLRETGEDGGYPVFQLVSTRSGHGRPTNLIFASPDKPDIRFSDAIDNDIEIVGNADKVLVHDRPLGSDGLRWRDLQAWWKESRGFDSDAEAKSTLYTRLKDILPANSSPQRNLYHLCHLAFGASVPDLPALLPEVWLHWDPQAARTRGKDALLRFRMDFLLLLPRRQRVVLEVDGKPLRQGRPRRPRHIRQEHACRPRPQALRLRSLPFRRPDELLDQEQALPMVQEFFHDLFRAFSVPLS